MKAVFEKVPRYAHESFGIFEFSGEAFDAPYHFHPEIEITWIVAGHGDMLIGDRLTRFDEGEVVVQGPGLPHSYRSDPGGSVASCWLQFLPSALGATFFELPECRRIRRGLERASRGLRLTSRYAGQAREILKRLTTAGGAHRLLGLLELLDVLSRDLHAESLASEGYVRAASDQGIARVDRILREIEHGWNEPMRLEAIARKVGMHPQSLSRFCRRHLRRSFQSLVIERRLSEAARRLLETEAGVAETAFACGFNNLANFNRLFRRAYRLNPRAYRLRVDRGQRPPERSPASAAHPCLSKPGRVQKSAP